jgi:hypothetical protein
MKASSWLRLTASNTIAESVPVAARSGCFLHIAIIQETSYLTKMGKQHVSMSRFFGSSARHVKQLMRCSPIF